MVDKKYNNKCDECGAAMCPYVYKGRNNNYLCGGTWYNKGCGQNICFICGKREEEKFRWEEYGKDCHGNKEMVKHVTPMFSQFERDENDPERKLNVLYCEEHKEEALKSPLKWTKEDTEKEIQREKEQKAQEEREREEKLNNQKNLFFLDGLTDSKSGSKTVRDYGAFLGRQNGQNYYLMIPFNHPIWDNEKTDPVVKKVIKNFWWDGNQEDFFIIEGVENIPLEKTPANYWHWLGKNKPVFHKIVGLNDKITIAEVGENQKNDKPIEDKTDNNQNKNTPVPNSVKEYFRKNSVKLIKLEREKWIVENNSGQIKEYSVSDTAVSEFQELKEYFSKTNKNILIRKELDLNTNSNNTAPTTRPEKNIPWIWIGCGIAGGIVIIAVIIRLLRKKRVKKK